MGVRSRSIGAQASARWVAALSLVAVVAVSAAALVAARTSGVSYWGTSLALIIGFPLAVLGTTVAGWWTYHRGDPVIGRWLLWVAASLFAYLTAVAALTWLVAIRGHQGPLVNWLALPALGGHVLPFVLLQMTLLTARDRLAALGNRGRPLVTALLTMAGANMLLGAAVLDPDSPLDSVTAPLAGTWLEAVADSWVSVVFYLAWLLSVLVGPVALWRALGRSTGMTRRRLSLAAVVSLLPVSVIVCCVLLLPVLIVADVSQSVAIEILFALFSLTFPLTAIGLAIAFSGKPELRLRTGTFAFSVHAAVGLLFALAAVALSTLLAVWLADGSVPLVVAGTVTVVALLTPLRRRVARRLLLRADPRLQVAATLIREANAQHGTQPAAAARHMLRTALEDPGLEVAVRLPDGPGWVSVDGTELPPPDDQPPGHLSVLTDTAGQSYAYVLHWTTTADAAGIVAEVRPLLDRAVLEVALRHQAQQLAEERARADRAAAEERRRLERDLHDGVQGRLLAVALDLQAADASTGDGEAQLVLTDAVSSLRTAIDEMRRLAAGSAPEILSREGLRAALADLVRRMPVPVRVTVPAVRPDAATETLAYLVISEAVTNAVKHAGPCTVDVSVTLDDAALGVRVTDDGSGGADVRAGTGLRGLTERVQAAGGTLVISGRRPHGTLVEAVLPCGR